ncbi:MAG: endonuclease/exonuclease/phosphatase family protein [Myxococcales bacterium]|nr:endonuclease/exonuclease/phosphatase family protein [Myxococcales bacterium]
MARDRVRIVTWNAWFGQLERAARRRALWRTLRAVDPDVICLQEMLPEDIDGPEPERWRARGYWVSDAYLVGYDVLMLGRIPVLHRERLPLPTQMGRNLLLVRLELDPPLTVATIHLESTAPMTQARVRQLRDIDARLAPEPNVVLVGDMNFSDDDPAETAEVRHWVDAWPRLHPGDPGFTIDSHVNEMRYLGKRRHVRARIDRVLWRGEGWRLRSIERLGTEPIEGDPLTFVSDHFGLVVEFERA